MSDTKPTQTADNQQIEVFFDGSCPLCSKEISIYKNTPSLCQIQYKDISSMQECEEKTKLMKRFHIKDQQGNIVSGAKAFVELWKNMKNWSYLAKIFDNKIGIFILEKLYICFLKIRPLIQTVFRKFHLHEEIKSK